MDHLTNHLEAKIVGMGTDLAEVDRIELSIARFGARFLERIYTAGEIAYVAGKANHFERYAARFAAKEAGMKALGTGWSGGIRWHDLEVTNLPSGRPMLLLHGKAAEHANGLGVRHIHLSLSHTATMAIAFVILEA